MITLDEKVESCEKALIKDDDLATVEFFVEEFQGEQLEKDPENEGVFIVGSKLIQA